MASNCVANVMSASVLNIKVKTAVKTYSRSILAVFTANHYDNHEFTAFPCSDMLILLVILAGSGTYIRLSGRTFRVNKHNSLFFCRQTLWGAAHGQPLATRENRGEFLISDDEQKE